MCVSCITFTRFLCTLLSFDEKELTIMKRNYVTFAVVPMATGLVESVLAASGDVIQVQANVQVEDFVTITDAEDSSLRITFE